MTSPYLERELAKLALTRTAANGRRGERDLIRDRARVLANVQPPDPAERLPLALLGRRDSATYALATLQTYAISLASSDSAMALLPALGRAKGQLRVAEARIRQLEDALSAAGYDLTTARKAEDIFGEQPE